MEDACPHTSGTSTFYICSSYDLTIDFQVQTVKKCYRFKLYLDLGWFIAFEFCNTFCTLRSWIKVRSYFWAYFPSKLTSSVLHAKARPYEATMSTQSVKHERYLIIFGPKVAIRTSAVAFAVSNLILCRSLAGAEAGAWVDSTNWPLRIGWPRPMGLEQGWAHMHCVHCTVYTVHFSLLSVNRKLYSIYSTVYSLQCVLYTVQLPVYSLHLGVQCTVTSVHFRAYSVQCTLHIGNYILFTVHCTQ